MINVYLISLNYLKRFLVSELASCVIIGILPSIVLLWLTMLTIRLISKRPVKLKIFNGYLVLSLVVIFNIIISNGACIKKLFSSYLDLSIYISVFTILAIFGNISLSVIKIKRKEKPKINKQLSIINNTEKQKIVEVIPCTEEGASVYSGYVDVKYVKSLIDALKQKSLEEGDLKEVEDFELYLLNFINRQPNSLERKRLSEYIGSLFKKLAKYNAI